MSYKIKDEPRKLAALLRGMVECGPAPDDLWTRDQPDGDSFVVRAAELLEEQETQLDLLTRMVDKFGSQLAAMKASANDQLGRLPEAEARRAVEAWLDENAPGYPTYTLAEDGEDGWAFWIVPQDTTSYVDPDGRIQWAGTGWPENYSYDGLTGSWLEVEAA